MDRHFEKTFNDVKIINGSRKLKQSQAFTVL